VSALETRLSATCRIRSRSSSISRLSGSSATSSTPVDDAAGATAVTLSRTMAARSPRARTTCIGPRSIWALWRRSSSLPEQVDVAADRGQRVVPEPDPAVVELLARYGTGSGHLLAGEPAVAILVEDQSQLAHPPEVALGEVHLHELTVPTIHRLVVAVHIEEQQPHDDRVEDGLGDPSLVLDPLERLRQPVTVGLRHLALVAQLLQRAVDRLGGPGRERADTGDQQGAGDVVPVGSRISSPGTDTVARPATRVTATPRRPRVRPSQRTGDAGHAQRGDGPREQRVDPAGQYPDGEVDGDERREDRLQGDRPWQDRRARAAGPACD